MASSSNSPEKSVRRKSIAPRRLSSEQRVVDSLFASPLPSAVPSAASERAADPSPQELLAQLPPLLPYIDETVQVGGAVGVDDAIRAIEREKELLLSRLRSALAQLQTARTDIQQQAENARKEMTEMSGLQLERSGQSAPSMNAYSNIIQQYCLVSLPEASVSTQTMVKPDLSLPLDNYELGFAPGRKTTTLSVPIMPDPLYTSTKMNDTLQLDTIKSTILPEDTHKSSGLLIEPASIHISDYTPMQIYVIQIHIINTSAHSVRHRVFEQSSILSSPHFHLALPTDTNDNNKTIAPGMRLTYKILFRPQTLSSYSETFSIVVEGVPPDILSVPILAALPPPMLTLASDLFLPPCRMECSVEHTWTVCNDGMTSNFIFVREAHPIHNFLESSNDDTAGSDIQSEDNIFHIPGNSSFTLTPKSFSLRRGQKITLAATYQSPPKVSDWLDEFEFYLMCNNQSVIRMTATCVVQQPQVNLIIDNDGQASPIGFKLFMGDQNPYGRTSRIVTIRNENLLSLPFRWDLSPVVGNGSAFTLTPNSGVLLPEHDTVCELVFAPEEAGSFQVQVDLMLDVQTKPQLLGSTQVLGRGAPYSWILNPPLLMFPRRLRSGKPYFTRTKLHNTSVNNLVLKWSLEHIDHRTLEVAVNAKETIAVGEKTDISVRLVGVWPTSINGYLVGCIQHSSRPVIIFPIQTSVDINEPLVCINPDHLKGETLEMDKQWSVTLSLVSKFNHELEWKIFSSDPSSHSGATTSDGKMDKESTALVLYNPPSGTLMPLDTVNPVVTFIPRQLGILQGSLHCQVKYLKDMIEYTTVFSNPQSDNTSSTVCFPLPCPIICTTIPYKAHVRAPQLHVSQSTVTLSNFFVKSRTVFLFKLVNDTSLETVFSWNSNCPDGVSLVLEPTEGTISGDSSVVITGYVHSETPGNFNSIYAICSVPGMVFNGGHIGLEVSGVCRDLTVQYCLLGMNNSVITAISEEEPLVIDFGNNGTLLSRYKLSLSVKNLSAIGVTFRVSFDKYSSPINQRTGSALSLKQHPSQSHYPLEGFRAKGAAINQDTLAVIRRFQEQNLQMLGQHTLGIVFQADPPIAQLSPYGNTIIDLVMCSNITGTFSDTLRIDFEDAWQHMSTVFPVRASITGSPVKFSGTPLIEMPTSAQSTSVLRTALNPTQWDKTIQLCPCLLHFDSMLPLSTDIAAPSTPSIVVSNTISPHQQPNTERPWTSTTVDTRPLPPLTTAKIFTKSIQVQNLSPYELGLRWHIFSWDGLASDELIQQAHIEEQLMSGQWVVRPKSKTYGMKIDLSGVFRVHPIEMSIPPFKIKTIRVEYSADVHRELSAAPVEQEQSSNKRLDSMPLLRKGMLIAQTLYDGRPWGISSMPLASPDSSSPEQQRSSVKRRLLEWASAAAVKLHIVAEMRRPLPPRLPTPESISAAGELGASAESTADLSIEIPLPEATDSTLAISPTKKKGKKSSSDKAQTPISSTLKIAAGANKRDRRFSTNPKNTGGATSSLPPIPKRREMI